jgi:hypothetical protein
MQFSVNLNPSAANLSSIVVLTTLPRHPRRVMAPIVCVYRRRMFHTIVFYAFVVLRPVRFSGGMLISLANYPFLLESYGRARIIAG